jgi:hypothetical protein
VPLEMTYTLGRLTHVEVMSSLFEDVVPLLYHSMDRGGWLEDVGSIEPCITWFWTASLDIGTIF